VAIFRLTPDKYYYSHVPVGRLVLDVYEVGGTCHSCNPLAVVAVAPFSKNRRVVTILETDVPGGARIGLVAMIELVALMIGDGVQCYSETGYALGEGLGRLACLSFGCCYGRPVAASHPLYQRLFARRHVTFSGRNKKAVYEGRLDHEPLIPIQAVTAVVYVGAALVGTWLFLHGPAIGSFLAVALVTQLRIPFGSEMSSSRSATGGIAAGGAGEGDVKT
jgi:Phosphatidylserine decarboxylase